MHDRAILRRTDFTLPGAEDHYPPDLELEPVHLDIALTVDLEGRSVAGTVTHTVRANRAGARSLRLHGVALEDVAVEDADGAPLAHDYDGREIAVTWERPFAHGEERRLAVTYRAAEPVTGLFFSGPDEGYPDAPRVAVTDHETERARHWLPTVDLPSVRPTLAFHLRADEAFTIVANGAHVEDEIHDDGTKTSHWRLEHRCPSYLTCFLVGDFVRVDDGAHRDAPIAYLAPPPVTEAMLKRSFGRTGEMLAWMEGKLDSALPWPKYFQFAARGIGGAMENISLVSWDDRWVMDEAIGQELGHFIDIVNLHEMAHTWFGDLIVVRDYAHAWLKESWATYMEACWLEDTEGRDAFLYDVFACGQAYLDEADSRYKRPIVTRRFDSSWNMYDRHLYPGGAYRLHMLRAELGDEVFWTGVRRYVERFAGETVETEDFRRVMEEVSGRSLVKWFDQWIYAKGYPHLDVSFAWDGEEARGTFTVTQKQVEADGSEEPCFDFDLDLAWVIDGERHTRRVRVRDGKAMFGVPMAAAPEIVRVNPEGRVLCKLDFDPGRDRLRRQLADEGDVLGRIHAGWKLAETGRAADAEAIGDAYRRERFWGVRVQLARALGKASSEAALAVLVELLADHDEPISLPSLIAAAGAYRDPRVVEVLEQRLDAGLLPKAREAAYVALGRQRDAAPLERLVQASAEAGVGGHAQGGALKGLAETRRVEALDVLIERARWGAIDLRARPAAALALGELAARLDRGPRERATEALRDLLRDPDAQVRRAAALGLKAAGADDAIGDLRSYRATLADQDRPELDRIVRAIRQAPEEAAKKHEDAMDELRAELRRLKDALRETQARLDA
ncbi:MAG TPA: M1 family aminopeptidase [Sandaracinaceae bacterium LLY-WYZ-13_1]|nr:M1 family aminopeptidase [Sandaracinaceae bacterium LLY-WYZ-13_1]